MPLNFKTYLHKIVSLCFLPMFLPMFLARGLNLPPTTFSVEVPLSA